MKVEFLGQPLSEEHRLGPLLGEALLDADSLLVIMAWVQTSGLVHLADGIRALRSRGGIPSAILGVDAGIATQESLELAHELFHPVHIFHDTGTRVFHPKMYCIERPREIVLAVGSSNLTGGGLFSNYEANILFRLDPDDADDLRVYEAVQAFRDALIQDRMPCKPLTLELIARLAEEETLITTRERREEIERAVRGKVESLARGVFGAPVEGLPRAPTVPATERALHERHIAEPVPGPTAAPVLRWWKRLTPSDVLRKAEGNARNYVVLNQARHDIDFLTWFRHELFGSVEWSEEMMRSRNVKEVALIPFHARFGGESVGVYELLVDHAEVRIADQNNAPTYLNWSSMIDIIRTYDFRDWWLELARYLTGPFDSDYFATSH